MYISSSLLASAVLLSFTQSAESRLLHQDADGEGELSAAHKPEHQGILQRWPPDKIFGKRQEDGGFTEVQCSTDDLYIEILDNAPSTAVQLLCNGLVDIPPATVTASYTATLTNFTSATATWTRTFPTTTTKTVTEIATITPAAFLRRAPGIAAKMAIANQIIQDIVISGSNATMLALPTLGAMSGQDGEALSGFKNACSCETVAPLSTTTVTDTIFETDTTTTTVASSFNQTDPASMTSPASITAIASGSSIPTASPSGLPSVPIVIGIPFQCPKDGAKANKLTPQFIVGDLRYEYSVLCDTAITDTEYLAAIQNVANETVCAAECSLVNNVAQRQLCQSASFVPNTGASDGQCFIHGSSQNFERRPGSTTIVLTSVSSKSDQCRAVDLVNGAGNTTVDTAQLVGSVITQDFSLSTPGLVTRSATGGTFETFFSSGYTDSLGWYYYTWYKVAGSSTAWWAAYATSWSCTASVSAQPTSGGMALTTAYSTATFNATAGAGLEGGPSATSVPSIIPASGIDLQGSASFIASGGTVSWFSTQGGGAIPPSAATATSVVGTGSQGSASFIASGNTGMWNSTQGGGAIAPTSPTATSAVGTGSQGSASFIASGGSAMWNSTAGGGAIPPTAPVQSSLTIILSTGTAIFTVSEATSVVNATGGNGGQPGVAPSTVANEWSISGGDSTWYSTGGSGAIPPSPTNTSLVGSLSSVIASSNSSSPSRLQSVPAATTSSLVLSSSGYGSGWPTLAKPSTNSTGSMLVGTGAASSGGAQFTSGGGTTVILSTGGVGSIGPPTPTVNGTLPVESGAQNFTVSGETAVTYLTQGSGQIPPSGTAPGSETPVPSTNVSISLGTGVASTSSSVLLTTNSEMSGVIPQPSANASETLLQTSEETDAASTGFIPPSSANLSIPASATVTPSPSLNSSLPSDSGVFVTPDGTTSFSFASGGGVVPPTLNVSATALPSLTPSLSANMSTTPVGTAPGSSGALDFSLSSFTAITLSTGTGGVIPPLTNLTTSAPVSQTQSPSANASSTTKDDFGNSLNDRTGRPRSSTISGTAPLVTAPISTSSSAPVVNSTSLPPPPPYIPNGGYGVRTSSSAILTSEITLATSTNQPSATLPLINANSSAVFPTASGSVPPSLALPPLSANSGAILPTASKTGPVFENSAGDRFGRPRSRTSLISSLPLSGTAPLPTGNFSYTGTAPAFSIPLSTGASGSLPAQSANITSVPLVTAPSGTGPTPIPSTGNFSFTDDLRTGRPRNSTVFLPSGTSAASTAPVALNSSVPIGSASIPLSTGAVLSTGGSASATVPFATANSTTILGTGFVSASPPPSSNSMTPFATGTGALSTDVPPTSLSSTLTPFLATAPSVTPSASLNSTDAADCPTPTPQIITHTTQITTVVTSLSYETSFPSPATCAPTSSLPFAANSTLPTGTAGTSALTASPSPRTYRRSGALATPDQIASACASPPTLNLVLNPTFAIAAADTAFGWTVSASDPSIRFSTTPTFSTEDGGEPHPALITTTTPTSTLSLSQPLTLCPGRTYTLRSTTRQANLLSQCRVEFFYGEVPLGTAVPQEFAAGREVRFGVGEGVESGSRDLRVVVGCKGGEEGGRGVEVELWGVGVSER